eukprot:GHVT01080444.1.p1 GENE.GHVT01080444.1~~GHVT01080444.1.p1  ORF type:complete len:405 (-),score=16.57 GHVT01080444.1:257-1471(-)
MIAPASTNGFYGRRTYMIFAAVAIFTLYCGHLLLVTVFRSASPQTLSSGSPGYHLYHDALKEHTFHNSTSHLMDVTTVAALLEALQRRGALFQSKETSRDEEVLTNERMRTFLRHSQEMHNRTQISVSKSIPIEIEQIGDPYERSMKFRMALHDDLPEAAKSWYPPDLLDWKNMTQREAHNNQLIKLSRSGTKVKDWDELGALITDTDGIDGFLWEQPVKNPQPEHFLHMTKPPIWFYWSKVGKPMPAYLKAIVDVCQHLNSNYFNVRVVNEDDLPNILPDIHPAFEFLTAVHKSDYLRVELLFVHGGIALDTDTIALRPFKKLYTECLQSHAVCGYNGTDSVLWGAERYALGDCMIGPTRQRTALFRLAHYRLWARLDAVEDVIKEVSGLVLSETRSTTRVSQ